MTLAALPACKKQDEGPGRASAELRDANGQVVGEATFEQVDAGVRIQFQGENLPPGTHGFHIHEIGECTPPAFESAGAHFNPTGAQHGLQSTEGPHAGDLPNLEVDDSGRARMDYLATGVRLDDSERSLIAGKGTALVIHADADDQRTDPSGNSGGRIACGVIRAP